MDAISKFENELITTLRFVVTYQSIDGVRTDQCFSPRIVSRLVRPIMIVRVGNRIKNRYQYEVCIETPDDYWQTGSPSLTVRLWINRKLNPHFNPKMFNWVNDCVDLSDLEPANE